VRTFEKMNPSDRREKRARIFVARSSNRSEKAEKGPVAKVIDPCTGAKEAFRHINEARDGETTWKPEKTAHGTFLRREKTRPAHGHSEPREGVRTARPDPCAPSIHFRVGQSDSLPGTNWHKQNTERVGSNAGTRHLRRGDQASIRGESGFIGFRDESRS